MKPQSIGVVCVLAALIVPPAIAIRGTGYSLTQQGVSPTQDTFPSEISPLGGARSVDNFRGASSLGWWETRDIKSHNIGPCVELVTDHSRDPYPKLNDKGQVIAQTVKIVPVIPVIVPHYQLNEEIAQEIKRLQKLLEQREEGGK